MITLPDLSLNAGLFLFGIGSLLDIATSVRFPPEIRERNPLFRSGRFFRTWLNLFSTIVAGLLLTTLPSVWGWPVNEVACGLALGGLVRAIVAAFNVRLRLRVRKLRAAFRAKYEQVPGSYFNSDD